jgi:SAM-dependent methyltransferase
MNDLDVQRDYWDSVAFSKTFSHPIPLATFRRLFPPTAKILDYGCGYGRVCSELADAGYRNVVGMDISSEMVRRGRALDHRLNLCVFDGLGAQFEDGAFDLGLLIAVLTCIPSDEGQMRVIHEIRRLIRPGGSLFLSDLPLQKDARNQGRYREFAKECGTFGVFRTEGAVVRHHDMPWIYRLLAGFDVMSCDTVHVMTMNGHEAEAFQILARAL